MICTFNFIDRTSGKYLSLGGIRRLSLMYIKLMYIARQLLAGPNVTYSAVSV